MSFSSLAQASWELSSLQYRNITIRTGLKKHTNLEYKGSILYLQGLADSLLNHDPLFDHLNSAGFDIVAFDYQGQGGSGGTMNSTRIDNINALAKIVWDKYNNPDKKKILLGWSTGGLAAYKYAYTTPNEVEAIILLAPGIVANKFVGETNLWGCLTSISIYYGKCKLIKITQSSLTQNTFLYEKNPHVDPIKPISPLVVPRFSIDLLKTSMKSRHWKISEQVKGMVYLSSPQDTYVDGAKTIEVIKKNANHLDYYQFSHGALHEIDNEIPVVTDYLKDDIVRFLSSL